MKYRRLIVAIVVAMAIGLFPRESMGSDAKVQATPSGDVKISYGEKQLVYWSSKYGFSFEIPAAYRIWAQEFVGQPNPLGEKYTGKQPIESPEFAVIRGADGTETIYLYFDEKQLTDEETKKWVEEIIRGWEVTSRWGMPRRTNLKTLQV